MEGGIYLASSVSSSCRVWDCVVDTKAVNRLGDVEYLRGVLPGPGMEMEAGQLYWITDRTPHESVPLKEASFRQFFRLVTSQVSLWYSDHSTPNPLGVVPDPSLTKIVKGDKFSDEGVEIIEFPDAQDPTWNPKKNKKEFSLQSTMNMPILCTYFRNYFLAWAVLVSVNVMGVVRIYRPCRSPHSSVYIWFIFKSGECCLKLFLLGSIFLPVLVCVLPARLKSAALLPWKMFKPLNVDTRVDLGTL